MTEREQGMSEISKYEAYKKKLQGICDENNLVYRFRQDQYPITLTIKPIQGVAEQMTLIEEAEDKGFTSPDAAIVFTIKDGVLTYKTHKTFTIGDALFSKIKNLFKNMHYYWLQFFFRDLMEKGVLTSRTMPVIDEETASDEDDLEVPDEEPLEDAQDLSDDDIPDDADRKRDETEETTGSELDADDPSIQEAARIVRTENKATLSLLQRRMNIGRVRAHYIMAALERLQIVGPVGENGIREVLPYDEPDDGQSLDANAETEG